MSATPSTAIHSSAALGFSSGADSYRRGRPDYPVEVDRWLRTELCLCAGRVAVDLGAGTGKFTPHLVSTQARVIAIEPIVEMLDQLTRALPDVEAHQGTAEAMPLPDASVDAIVCAQSFHWFATPAVLAEICRVLTPGGKLGLVWNMRDERMAWVARLADIIAPYEGDTPRYYKGDWRNVFPFPGLSPLEEEHFSNTHTGAPEQVIVDRIISTSFIAALPREERDHVAAQIRDLVASEPSLAGRSEVTLPYDTAVFRCEKLETTARR